MALNKLVPEVNANGHERNAHGFYRHYCRTEQLVSVLWLRCLSVQAFMPQ